MCYNFIHYHYIFFLIFFCSYYPKSKYNTTSYQVLIPLSLIFHGTNNLHEEFRWVVHDIDQRLRYNNVYIIFYYHCQIQKKILLVLHQTFFFLCYSWIKNSTEKKEQKTFRQQNFCCKTPSPTLNVIEELSYRN